MIHLKQVAFSWKQSDTPLFEIPSWEVEQGEHLLIRGASGSGKTTLLSLLSGIELVSEGSLQILDTELKTLSAVKRDSFRANYIGYIFQQLNLFPYLTVRENLSVVPFFSQIKKQQILESASMHSHKKSVEAESDYLLELVGLADEMSKKVSELSMGEKQRVAIVRAFLGNPPLILADEPTSALDDENKELFMKLLFNIADEKKSSIVFVSHDMSLLPYFEKTLELKNGNLSPQ